MAITRWREEQVVTENRRRGKHQVPRPTVYNKGKVVAQVCEGSVVCVRACMPSQGVRVAVKGSVQQAMP